jgi:hypothetical protein
VPNYSAGKELIEVTIERRLIFESVFRFGVEPISISIDDFNFAAISFRRS